jgi:hypothetical protein
MEESGFAEFPQRYKAKAKCSEKRSMRHLLKLMEQMFAWGQFEFKNKKLSWSNGIKRPKDIYL